MNRELAKDILIQSDRLVDLLLPIDSMTRQPSLGPGGTTSSAPPFLLQGAVDRVTVQNAQRSSQGEGQVGGMEFAEVVGGKEGGEDDVDFQEVLVSPCVCMCCTSVTLLRNVLLLLHRVGSCPPHNDTHTPIWILSMSLIPAAHACSVWRRTRRYNRRLKRCDLPTMVPRQAGAVGQGRKPVWPRVEWMKHWNLS